MVTRGAKGILITPADSKAIVPSIKKARDAGVTVIALDTPTEPEDAADALFATDNKKAGVLIGQWAKAKFEKDGQGGQGRHDRPRAGHLRRRAAPRRLPRGLRDHRQGGPRPRRRRWRPDQGAGRDGEPAPEGPGREPRLHHQRAVGVRRLQRAQGGRQGEAGDDRVRRRRLRGDREGHQARRDRRHVAAVPAEHGQARRRGDRQGREALGLQGHRRDPDHRRPAGGRRLQGLHVRRRRTAGARGMAHTEIESAAQMAPPSGPGRGEGRAARPASGWRSSAR